jgi:uncharacterized SAM-binding protein YcdF (DUF218 family)
MYTIYTILKFFIRPELWIFTGLCAGCLIAWSRQCPRSIRFILCLVLIFYYGFTTRPLSDALVWPLETYHHSLVTMPTHHDAIVILTEGMPARPDTARPTVIGTDNVERLVCGLGYVRADPTSKVVLTIVETGVSHDTVLQATVLQQWAVILGYPAGAIITSDQGVATHERARAIKRLLGSTNQILLVDSAMHLRRSVAAFKKAGFNVTPIPCNFQTSTDPWDLPDFVPSAENFRASSEAVYEYTGLLMYWLRGLI